MRPTIFVLGVFLAFQTILPSVLGNQKTPKLNFVVFMADDLGASDLGCYGNRKHKTPYLDELARNGVRYRTCYSTPICSPSRIMIMTGRYGFRTGWYNFTGRPGSPTYRNSKYDLGTAEVTFADILKTQGYATCLVGKWQLTGEIPTLVNDCGFDEYRIWAYKHNLPKGVEHTGGWEGQKGGRTARFWHPSIMENGKYLPTKGTDYGPDLFADFAIDFIRRHKSRPFLVYYPMVLTHTPWEPAPHPTKVGEKTPRGLMYNVESMDRVVGRIVTTLKKLQLDENTVVIFTGDNGTQGAGKALPIEMGVRVPLIVSCPGTVEKGVVTDELADLTDILPTLADFAGANLPQDRKFDGVSLVSQLKGLKGPRREWVFSYIHERRVLRDKRWLLEGDGRFFDCGDRRTPKMDAATVYKDVTNSQSPEVLAAKARFAKILTGLPAPKGLALCPYAAPQWQRYLKKRNRK